MALNKNQEDLYRKTMDEVKKQLDSIDSLVEQELQKVREKLAQLQEYPQDGLRGDGQASRDRNRTRGRIGERSLSNGQDVSEQEQGGMVFA
jgi:signal transduction histidine kinase